MSSENKQRQINEIRSLVSGVNFVLGTGKTLAISFIKDQKLNQKLDTAKLAVEDVLVYIRSKIEK